MAHVTKVDDRFVPLRFAFRGTERFFLIFRRRGMWVFSNRDGYRFVIAQFGGAPMEFDLAPLKRRLQTAKELKKILEYFLDHYGDHNEFREMGVPDYPDYLQEIVIRVCIEIMSSVPRAVAGAIGDMVMLENHFMLRVGEHFYHGSGQIGGNVLVVLYFADINKGLCAISLPNETKFSRFTAVPISPDERAKDAQSN